MYPCIVRSRHNYISSRCLELMLSHRLACGCHSALQVYDILSVLFLFSLAGMMPLLQIGELTAILTRGTKAISLLLNVLVFQVRPKQQLRRVESRLRAAVAVLVRCSVRPAAASLCCGILPLLLLLLLLLPPLLLHLLQPLMRACMPCLDCLLQVVPTTLEFFMVLALLQLRVGWTVAATAVATISAYWAFTAVVTTRRAKLRRELNRLEGLSAGKQNVQVQLSVSFPISDDGSLSADLL